MAVPHFLKIVVWNGVLVLVAHTCIGFHVAAEKKHVHQTRGLPIVGDM